MHRSEEYLKKLINLLIKRGLTQEQAIKFIELNPKLLKYSIEDIVYKLTVVLNNNTVYGVIFCDKNNLYWCINENGILEGLFEKLESNSIDYIIQMIVTNAYRDKIKEYLDGEDTLENRLKIYKDISGDSPGYKVK